MEFHNIINITLTIILCYLTIYTISKKGSRILDYFHDVCNCPTIPNLNYQNGSSIPQLFNIRTRGEKTNYELVGLLYNTNSSNNYNLYGRQNYRGSPEWEYTIATKNAGGMEIFYELPNKEEIRTGDIITVPIDGKEYTVTMYNYNNLKNNYNPYVY